MTNEVYEKFKFEVYLILILEKCDISILHQIRSFCFVEVKIVLESYIRKQESGMYREKNIFISEVVLLDFLYANWIAINNIGVNEYII